MTKSGATNDKRARQRVVVGHVPHLVAQGAADERDAVEEEVVGEEGVDGGRGRVEEAEEGRRCRGQRGAQEEEQRGLPAGERARGVRCESGHLRSLEEARTRKGVGLP